jgi:ABC-2 type transport system permease protein
MSTVFGFFILSMLGSVIGDEAVRWISPFQYFDLPAIVKNGTYEAPYMITGAIFVLAAIVTSYIVYIKKDVHSV